MPSRRSGSSCPGPGAILRRFARSNVRHPAYKGLAELGKGGEVASDRLDDREASASALHLLRSCLAYALHAPSD